MAVPGRFDAVNVAVCTPVVAELLTMRSGVPGTSPTSASAAPEFCAAFTVSVTPLPPEVGALSVYSFFEFTESPTAATVELPVVASAGWYGSQVRLPPV